MRSLDDAAGRRRRSLRSRQFARRSAVPRPVARGVLVFALLAAALGAVLAGCATNPVTGRRELSLVSAGQEEQIGREGYKAVLAEYGLYEDQAIQTWHDGIGQRLARVSHLPNLQWHFTVIDDPTVNAFAMPGGYIYTTRGIMAHLNSEGQLAGVLGHEIGHVTARHSAEQITRTQLAGLGLVVGSVLSPTLARYGQVAEQALGLMFLKYSRDNERESDELGVRYSTAAGFDPREIPGTYALLQRIGERGGQRLPSFLSTHPDPGDRQARTTELARAAAAGKTGLTVNSDSYLDRLDGMVYGTDPRQGYFEGARFYHPEMRFVMDFPSGWTYQNGRTAVLAVAPQQRAAMQLSLTNPQGMSPSAFVAQLQQSGRIAEARGRSETIGGQPAWVGQIAVPAEGGQQRVLAAAFIARTADQMFQILGQGEPEFEGILASARSMVPLQDAARLSPTPARIRIVRVVTAGTFANVIAAQGPQGATVEDLALLNGVTEDERIAAGRRIKTVTPPRLRS